jgi:hypothetical protein
MADPTQTDTEDDRPIIYDPTFAKAADNLTRFMWEYRAFGSSKVHAAIEESLTLARASKEPFSVLDHAQHLLEASIMSLTGPPLIDNEGRMNVKLTPEQLRRFRQGEIAARYLEAFGKDLATALLHMSAVADDPLHWSLQRTSLRAVFAELGLSPSGEKLPTSPTEATTDET